MKRSPGQRIQRLVGPNENNTRSAGWDFVRVKKAHFSLDFGGTDHHEDAATIFQRNHGFRKHLQIKHQNLVFARTKCRLGRRSRRPGQAVPYPPGHGYGRSLSGMSKFDNLAGALKRADLCYGARRPHGNCLAKRQGSTSQRSRNHAADSARIKERSIYNLALPMSCGVNSCGKVVEVFGKLDKPAPVCAETGNIGDESRKESFTFPRMSPLSCQPFDSSEVSLVDDDNTVPDARSLTIWKCSWLCGIQPSSAATTSMTQSMPPAPAIMFLTNRSWPGHRQIQSPRPTASEERRNQDLSSYASFFFRETVGISTGESFDYRRLAVIDMSAFQR